MFTVAGKWRVLKARMGAAMRNLFGWEITRLFGWEIRKLRELPMAAAYLALCLAFNLLLILNGRYGDAGGDYVRYISGITQVTGGQMGEEFRERLEALPESAARDLLLTQTEGAEDILEEYSTAETAQSYFTLFRISGTAAQILERKYDKQQSSVELLAQKDASLSLCAAEMTQPLMEALFHKLCRAALTEGLLFAVLLALYLRTFEYARHTQLVVYTTRMGRRIEEVKGIAGLVAALAGYGVIAGISTAVFSAVWRLGPVWNSNVSSQFHTVSVPGMATPFVTWASFSLKGYLAATLGLGAVGVALFYGLGLAAGLAFRNAYTGFLLWFAATAVNMEILLLAGDRGVWTVYAAMQWSPAAFWWFQPLWFTDMGINGYVPWQECSAVLFCMVCCCLLLWLGFRKFYRKDIGG